MHDDERFQDLVRRTAPLTYATRCRVVADEVRGQHTAPNLPAAGAWLDDQLARLSTTPGTMAELLLPTASEEPEIRTRMIDLRVWAFGRLRTTDPTIWADGANSWPMWALLMAPVPSNEDELLWLAQSTQIGAVELRALSDAWPDGLIDGDLASERVDEPRVSVR